MKVATSNPTIYLAHILAENFRRFLADRFVEGICPYCGSDVGSEHTFVTLRLYTVRMVVVTNVIPAAEH